MGKITRKRHTVEFKAKVVLEAMRGEQTLAGLGTKYGIHQAMIAEQAGDRFGNSHRTVRRRVKLAKISPWIMDESSTDKATLQQIEALAVVDDHGAQEDTFFNLPEWNRDERNIRARLTSEKISADSRLVQFVGLDACREADGTITQDPWHET